MKLNLGCGTDIRSGYVNVDHYPEQADRDRVLDVDLSLVPWPFVDRSAEQVLMFDFLEHLPYAQTTVILDEVYRILVPGGEVQVQVPDMDACARAVLWEPPFCCNRCGQSYDTRI